MLPNFFIIGAAKSGTTSLWHYLGEHPDVFVADLKEPNHFSPLAPPRFPDRADYEALFQGGAGASAVGEASVAYLHDPSTPGLLADAVPDARLLAVLRDPVDRAYSQYRYNRQRDLEPEATFAGALAAEPRVIETGDHMRRRYVERGRYDEQLSRYQTWHDRGRLLVFLYEDLASDPGRVMREVFTFLDIDPDVPLDLGVRHHISGNLLRRTALGAVQPGRSSVLPRRVRTAVLRLADRSIPRADRRAMAELRERLAPDNERLQARLGRDLSAWLPR